MKRLVKIGAVVLAGLFLVVATTLAWSTAWLEALGSRAEGPRLERMQGSPQYGDGVFVNDPPVEMQVESDPSAMWEVGKEWMRSDVERVPRSELPVEDPHDVLAEPPASGLRITWLGHSTVLIEIDGVRLLTDPIWSERASPSTLVGPRRFHPPPLDLDDLGELDAVLISHDHYDHLDYRTIESLSERKIPFFVPLGVGAHLEGWGVPTPMIREFDWWESTRFEGLELVSTPARHFSGRGVLDRNSTLWTSWTVLGPDHRVYFSGDTGLTPQFEEIGERYGPFDVTMLEVGAYHPTWGEIHLGPKNAVRAHEMLGGRGALLPIHWSTFELAIHGWSEPAEETRRAGDRAGVSVATPLLGAPFEPTIEVPAHPWWR